MMRKLGPHSRPHKLQLIDGRRAEARRLKEIREELSAHCGGDPTAPQRLLIERVSLLLLRLELFDKQNLAGDMPDSAHRAYLGWVNAATRSLRHLGLEAPPTRSKSVLELLAAARASGSR
jgi:hypothetical protein